MLGRRHALGGLAALASTAAFWPGAVRADETLFDRLGGMDAISRIAKTAVALFLADPRVKSEFEEIDPARLSTRLAEQICELSGGPCVYHGRSMREAHAGLHSNRAQFNATAEDLQQAMETEGVPYWTQNRLLALLAPMQRDIVTR